MLDSIKKFAVEHWLRHYRDPASWAGLCVLILTHFHIQPSAELVTLLEGILANVIGILLIWMDGRINPHIDPSTGRIPPRGDDATVVVQAGPHHEDGVSSAAGGTGHHVPTGSGTTVRKAAESDQDPPGFNDNGAN